MSEDIEARVKALSPLLQGEAAAFEQGAFELRKLDAANPNDAYVQYLIGSAYDSCGWPALAITHYDRAFALGVAGLPDARRPEIFVQAGSTLRNLKRYSDARSTFDRGIAQYPEYRALRVFAAMNETSAGDAAAAARHLYVFVLMPEDGSIMRFRRALSWYVDDILKTTEGSRA